MRLELQNQIEIDTSPGDLPLAITCRRCPWAVDIDSPILLPDLIDAAEEHFDDSGRCVTAPKPGGAA